MDTQFDYMTRAEVDLTHEQWEAYLNAKRTFKLVPVKLMSEKENALRKAREKYSDKWESLTYTEILKIIDVNITRDHEHEVRDNIVAVYSFMLGKAALEEIATMKDIDGDPLIHLMSK